ncbi:hypothetical protein HDU80_003199 [Chytriomyces hyalinus]|nr:hypothetical protein HDU80_003199 [Chytriomyces hyalinus]
MEKMDTRQTSTSKHWSYATDAYVETCKTALGTPSFKEWIGIVCARLGVDSFLDSANPRVWHSRFITSLKSGGFKQEFIEIQFDYTLTNVVTTLQCMDFTRKVRAASKPLAIIGIEQLAEEEKQSLKRTSCEAPPDQPDLVDEQTLKEHESNSESVQDAEIKPQERVKHRQPEQEDATLCDHHDNDALPPRVAASQLIPLTKLGPQDDTRFKSYHDTLSKLLKSQSLDAQQKGRHWRTKANWNCYENNLLTELGINEVAPTLTFKAQHKIGLNMKSLANLWRENAAHKTMLRKLASLVEDGLVVAVEAVGDNIPEHPDTVWYMGC